MGPNGSHRGLVQAALAACVLGIISLPRADADQTKADNATALNQATSWVGGVAVPGPADLAIFNSTLLINNTFSLGDNSQSWLGIRLLNPASNITISAGNLLTLGTGGIDMTAATVNLSLNNSLTLTGAGQTWDTGTTSTLLSVGPLALGTGTLTTQGSGVVSISGNTSGGAGNRIIQNGAGSLLLSGTNSFARLTFNSGSVKLGSAGAIPAASVMDAVGGTLDLNGFNATVSSLTGAAGIITDNSAGAGTTSFTVNQSSNQTFSGNINNGGTRILALVKASSGSFTLSGASTYSGGTTVNQGFLLANNNSALGTGNVTLNTVGGAVTHLHVNGGITIANNITTNATIAGAGNNGVIQYGAGTGNATISGTVTFAGPNVTQGGDIGGATAASTFLNFTGPLLFGANPGRTFIIVRFGNVSFSGGGNYTAIDLRTGTTILGANNGIATSAVVDLAGNGTETLDLNGFNQTLPGVKNTVTPGNTKTITNSSATFATLTFATTSTGNFTFGGAGTANMTGNLNIAMNGDPAGIQALSTASSSYVGTTTLTSGILSVTALSDGGVASSIGAATSDQANLVFGGGTLRYTGGFASSNHDFTINSGKTASIDVSTASATLILTGNTPTASTGGLTKLGPGTLNLTGTHSYTGNTTVSAGTLQMDGSLAAGSAVSVAAGASLRGNGNIHGVVNMSSGGILAPGASVGTLTVGGLTLNGGSVTNLEFSGSANDRITVSNAGGLTLNGGNINLFQEGTSTGFSTNGTYSLIGYNTNFTGSVNNLGITNPQAGKFYTLVDNAIAHTIELSIGDATSSEWLNPAGSLWTTGANWNNGIPNAVGITAKFGQNLASPGTITLNGAKTVSGMIFDNFNGYTIGAGADTLTVNNGAASAAVSIVTGSHVIAAPIVLNSAMTVTTPGAILTISGNISGPKGLALSGSGNLFLTGTNSYTTTNINGGTLTVGDGGTVGTLGTGDVTIAATATLSINRSNAITIASNILGSGGIFNAAGTGTIVLTGNNSFGTAAGGALIINGSVVKAGSAGAIPAGVLLIANAGALDLNGFNATVGDLTGGAPISDSSAVPGTTTLTLVGVNSGFFAAGINNGAGGRIIALSKRDSGSATLAAASTYSGGTSLIQGVLNVGATGALGTGDITMGISGSNITRLDVAANLANNIIINAVSPGSGLGSINGVQAAVISGNVTVNVASPGGVGHLSGPNGGVLEFLGKINSSASLIIRGGNVRLSGGGSYTDLQMQSGTTSIGANDGIVTTTNVAMGTNGAATFDLNGFNQTLASISSASNNNVVTNTGALATLTLNTPLDVNMAAGGALALQGSLSLVKSGPANVTITTNNTYVGQTTINQGALIIANNASLGAPATGAALTLNGGTLQTAATFALDNGTNGNSRNISLLAGGGTFNLTAGNTLTISGIISGAGVLNLTAGKLLITGASNYTGNSTVGATATVEYSGSVSHNTGLFIAAGAVQIDPAATVNVKTNASLTNRTSTMGALNLSGTTGAWTSLLNLANNNSIIGGGGGANVVDQIKQAAHLGAWNGTGGITSSAALAASTGSTATALGYASGADFTTGNGKTALDGISFSPTDTLVMYTLAGDANLDGSVTFADFLQLQNNYNKTNTNWEQGDWNYDGSTTFADFLALQNNYNKTLAVGSLLVSGGASAVPEPGTLLVLASGALLLRRRKRSGRG